MKISRNSIAIVAALSQSSANAFTVSSNTRLMTVGESSLKSYEHSSTTLFNAAEPSEEEMVSIMEKTKLTDEEVEKVGNLVTDDEWMGLGMELSEIVRCAVLEDVKRNTADFIGKEDYKVGDVSKEIDNRVKVSRIGIRATIVLSAYVMSSHLTVVRDYYHRVRLPR